MRAEAVAGRGGSGLVIALATLAALLWFAWQGAPRAGLVLLALAAAIEIFLLSRLARATAGGVGGHAEWVRDVSLRPRLRSSRAWALAAALALAGSLLCLFGCAEPPVVITRPGVTSLLPHLAPVASNERLLYGDEAVLADVARPVLDQLRPFPLAVRCALAAPGVGPSCNYELPAELPAAGHVLVEGTWPAEPPRDIAGHAEARTERVQPRFREVRPGVEIGGGPRAVPQPLRSTLSARSVPRLDERDWESSPLVLPRGGRLRLAVGGEEPSSHIDSAPVEFAVVVIDAAGRRTIARRRLDPAGAAGDRAWRELAVELPAGADPFRLRLEARPVDPTDGRPQLPLWADPRIVVEASAAPAPSPASGAGSLPPSARPPMVVLISLDTLRARSLSTYGHDLETSPRLTEFARAGTLFTEAATTWVNTLAAHMSLLTGRYPASHGVLWSTLALDAGVPTLAELLRTAGYETAAFTENALLMGHLGFRRGFGRYEENKSVGRGAGDPQGTFARTLRWVRQNATHAGFVFVHTYAVHAPYDPAPELDALFGEPGDAPGAHDRRLYEREIRELDTLLDRFVRDLEAAVGQGRLLVVVTGDHGEEFLEHGASSHVQLFEEVLHVPLVWHWPGVVAAGRRIDVPVSLIDIAPTILDLIGAAPAPGMDGLSLAPLLRAGQPPGDLGRSFVLAEQPPIPGQTEAWHFVARGTSLKCWIDGGDGAATCFDLAADPGELAPLAPGARPGLAELVAAADAHRERALARPAAGQQPARPAAEDAERRRKLEALGYLER